MDISIIVPCFNEEKNIEYCIRSLLNLDYNDGAHEIIVVDGGSSDETQRIVRKMILDNRNIALVVEHKKGVAAGRNAGIKAAKYAHVALIDADCEAPSNWLTVLVAGYRDITSKDDMVIAAGGGNYPPERSSRFLKAIGFALDSYIGSFNSAQGRQFKTKRYVPSLANLNVLYRKDKLIEVGNYNESLLSEAEDADLNYRLSLLGYKFVFIPGSFVWHKMRPTPRTWMRNMFRYGKGRARLLKRYSAMWNVAFVMPILFALTMLSIALSPFNKLFLLPLLYFMVIMVFSFVMCFKKRDLSLVLHVMVVYIIQHFGYAFGEVYGLLDPRTR